MTSRRLYNLGNSSNEQPNRSAAMTESYSVGLRKHATVACYLIRVGADRYGAGIGAAMTTLD